MRDGCTITTTLLAKDTAHRSVFPVFTPGGGFGMPEMEGGADIVMIPDPTTFQVLPWAPRTVAELLLNPSDAPDTIAAIRFPFFLTVGIVYPGIGE